MALMASNIKAVVEGCIDGVCSDRAIYNMAIEITEKRLFSGKLIKPSVFKTAVMQDIAYVIAAPTHNDLSWKVAKLTQYTTLIFQEGIRRKLSRAILNV